MFKFNWMLLLVFVIFCGIMLGQFNFKMNTAFGDSSIITVNLTETPEAFKNPMKGFRPSRYIHDTSFKDYEYTSTYKHYIAYTNLEYYATDSIQKIVDYCNSAWVGIENKNRKVIPRVVIYYPGTGEYWGDIPHSGVDSADSWTSSTLKSRLVAMAAKLAQAWDNDPRVAAVELGLWGKWGEHNIYPTVIPGSSFNDRIPADFQQALGDAFTNAFHNKKVMVRYPETFTSYNFGYIWDSFALPDDAACGNGVIARNCWQTQMISGEVAYDWGNQSQLGGSPNGTLSSDSNTNYVIGWIRNTHTSSLGWIAEYTTNGSDEVEYNATRMQKALGYRLVINQASFSSRADQGGTLTVSLNVSNVGNAPFYYNWPVQVSLLKTDRTVAWSNTLDTDITKWLPGNSYTVSGNFTIPASLGNGTYTLALAVLDPAGNQPSLRFANTNYYLGGRTPVGKVGVGENPSGQNLGSFDGLKNDNTLSYSLTTSPTPTPTGTPTSSPTITPTPTPVAGGITVDSFPSQTQFSNNQNDLGQSISWVMDSCYYGSDSCGNVVMCSSPSGQYFQENINQSLAGKTYLVLRIRDWWNSDSAQHWKIVLNDGTDHTVGPLIHYGNVTGSYTNISIPLSAFGANLAQVKSINLVHHDSTYAVLLIDAIIVN